MNEIYLLWHNNEWQRAIKAEPKKIILIDRVKDIVDDYHESQKKQIRIPHLFGRKLFSSLCYVEGLKPIDKEKLIGKECAYFNVSTDVQTKCIILTLVR